MLEEAEEIFENTFGVMSETKKLIGELYSDFYKDKIIRSLIILILLLIITVSIMGFFKKKTLLI